jgi:hypothetical protein
MTQRTFAPAWVTDSFFTKANPCVCTITKSYEAPNENYPNKTDWIVELDNGTYHAKINVFGDNERKLLAACANETDNAVGKKIRLSQTTIEGKKKRLLDVL